MTPGPVPVPPEVLEVLALPMEHHRTPEFVALFGRVLMQLKQVFVTNEAAFIHTSTGSGAMESALVNILSPGDHVLAIVSGKFGERWAEMAEVFGAKVTRLNVPWGQAVDVNQVEEALKQAPDLKAVLCQACETSTAVLHPVQNLARVISGHKAVFVVDAITALGALPMPMDQWGIDIMIGGSQKAFMLPTGLSFISFSKKAWALTEKAKCPKYYFDIRREKKANDAGESYFSTSVTHIRALERVLEIFLKTGMDKVHARISALAEATAVGARDLGLKIYAQTPSPSLTALVMPEGVDGQKVREDMEKSQHVVVMGGQDQLKGKIIRIGHMGAISDDDLLKTLAALASSINKLKPNSISPAQIANAAKSAAAILAKTPPVFQLKSSK